jgi:hypothetical protein
LVQFDFHRLLLSYFLFFIRHHFFHGWPTVSSHFPSKVRLNCPVAFVTRFILGFFSPFVFFIPSFFSQPFSVPTCAYFFWFSDFSFEKRSDTWISARFPKKTICMRLFCTDFSVPCYCCFADTTSMSFLANFADITHFRFWNLAWSLRVFSQP